MLCGCVAGERSELFVAGEGGAEVAWEAVVAVEVHFCEEEDGVGVIVGVGCGLENVEGVG